MADLSGAQVHLTGQANAMHLTGQHDLLFICMHSPFLVKQLEKYFLNVVNTFKFINAERKILNACICVKR